MERHVVGELAGVRALKPGHSFLLRLGNFISLLANYDHYDAIVEMEWFVF